MQSGPETQRRHYHSGTGRGAPLLVQAAEVRRDSAVCLRIFRLFEPSQRRLVRAARIVGNRCPPKSADALGGASAGDMVVFLVWFENTREMGRQFVSGIARRTASTLSWLRHGSLHTKDNTEVLRN